MKTNVLGSAVLLTIASACASAPQPAVEEPAAPAAEPAPAAAPVAVAPPAPVEPTPEEKAKAAKLAELEKERADMRAKHQAEVARITPELHAEAKTLAEKSYASTPAALKVILKSPLRTPGNAERDAQRHPLETLQFIGVKPTQTVLEVGPGEGWYTEILAPLLAAKGKLLVTSPDPNGPADSGATYYGEKIKLKLETVPELYGKVETVIVDGKAPVLPQEGTVDTILLFRGAHGLNNQGTLNAYLAEFHKALKPKGVLGIEQHRAADDADPAVSSKKGYLPQKWLIEQVEAAGFKLAGKSEINANKKDTKDYPDGVWNLPPTLSGGETDKDKYLAIGESDRMTLKFVKVEAKKKPEAAPTAGPVNTTPKSTAEASADKPAAAAKAAAPAKPSATKPVETATAPAPAPNAPVKAN